MMHVESFLLSRPSVCLRPLAVILPIAALTFLSLLAGRALFIQAYSPDILKPLHISPPSSACDKNHLAFCEPPSVKGTDAYHLKALELQLLQSAWSKRSKRSTIGKVFVRYGKYLDDYEPAFASHQLHSLLHGYEHFVLDSPIIDGLWVKEAALLQIILEQLALPENERLQWLMWADADTLILNALIPVELFLPPESESELADVHLLHTKDWNGLNNGVFFLRVSSWSIDFLSAILAYRTFKPDAELAFTEQSAMANVLEMPEYKDKAVECPAPWFNGYQSDGEHDKEQQVREGGLLVHFPGVEDKLAAIGQWVDKCRNERSSCEKVFGDMPGYLEEIETFWEEVRSRRRDGDPKVE
ncbi:hypothetical protein D0864_01160 [Hortaea werneckii]|uniref:Galactosyl transferase GMA12/MNN10 family protein n=1 Tax=Hortaea werneckii TaxID=91943 RepID=A0A3M7HD22_HORWE|nr:hypothetical protein D0864_01160 [Hortaea werneckii]